MPFVADDLGSWLISALAEAGRKKLTTLILGTDQQRALCSAAAAAVQFTAEQLRPDEEEQAEHVARVISEVFSEPVPYAHFAWRARPCSKRCRRGSPGSLQYSMTRT
jgi:hypothetical protein